MERFCYEFEETLTYLNAPSEECGRLRTTNAIERFIGELNKKIQRVGIFPTAESLERTVYVVWRRLHRQGYGRVKRRKPLPVFTPNY